MKIFQFLLISFFCFLLLGCSHKLGSTTTINIDLLSLYNLNGLSENSSIIPILIPIKITNSSGVILQKNLNSETNSIELPNGKFHIQVGFLAKIIQNESSDICDNNETETNSFISKSFYYTEFNRDFENTINNDSIKIQFQNPLQSISFGHFGFKIYDMQGNPARYAKIFYEDAISGEKIKDPCSHIPLSDISDDEGRIAVDLPIYNYSSQLKLQVILEEDEVSKDFLFSFNRQKKQAQFYKLNMSNNLISSYDEQTESFLEDGTSISYRRDILNKNPRFPDIPNFKIQTPNQEDGNLSFLDNLTDNILLNSYDLITKRSFIVYCQFSKINQDDQKIILLPTQNCNKPVANIFDFLNKFDKKLIIEAKLMDSENFIASNNLDDVKIILKN